MYEADNNNKHVVEIAGNEGRKGCQAIESLRRKIAQSKLDNRAREFTFLFDLLQAYRAFQSTDLRDKTYALLGLATDIHGAPPPDYTQHVASVYHNYARFFVRCGYGIKLLSQAGLA